MALQLSLHENWEKYVSPEGKALLQQMVRKLEMPGENEVRFVGFHLGKTEEGGYKVKVLILNGTEKAVRFRQLPLFLKDKNGDVFASGVFKPEKLGAVPAKSIRPWEFSFGPEFVKKENPDLSQWSITNM